MQNIYRPTAPAYEPTAPAIDGEYQVSMQYAAERQPYGLGLTFASRPTCVTPAPAPAPAQGPMQASSRHPPAAAYYSAAPVAQRAPSSPYTCIQQYRQAGSQLPTPYYTPPGYSMVTGWGTPMSLSAPQMTPSPIRRPRSVALAMPPAAEYMYQAPQSYYYANYQGVVPADVQAQQQQPVPMPMLQTLRTQSLPPIKMFPEYQTPISQHSSRVSSPMIKLGMRAPAHQRQMDAAQGIAQGASQGAPEFARKDSRKRYHSSDGYNKRNSSIAGTIYNSTAVYKRLKPCTSAGSPAQDSAVQGLRPQGRPFSSNITGRFLVHHDLFSLFRYMNKKNLQVLACYDMRDLDKGTEEKSSIKTRGDEKNASAEQREAGDKSADCPCGTHTNGAQDAFSLACKFEDIHLGPFEGAADFVPILDGFFSRKHCSLRVLNNGANGSKPDRAKTPPEQRTISYKPSAGAAVAAGDGAGAAGNSSGNSSGSATAIGTPESSCSPEKSNEPDRLQESNGSDQASPKQQELRSPHTLQFILNNLDAKKNPDQEGKHEKRMDDKARGVSANFHDQIVKAFGIEEYQFIKAIRDSNGHVLKLESIRPPRNSSHQIEYTAEWVKKTICYPRYKGGMKIHLTSASQSFVLYSDMKMLLWDVTQEDKLLGTSTYMGSSPASAITNGLPPLCPETKERLFGGRLVFVKTDGS